MALPSKFDRKQLSNLTQDLTPQCKIVVYPWNMTTLTQNSGQDTQLAKTTPLDVSSQVVGCTFSKQMGQPAGSFSFTLSNSPQYGSGDWKDILKRGTWCVIYMTQNGDLVTTSKVGRPDQNAKKQDEAQNIRCIGFIDRVASKVEMTGNGTFDITYEVSGRDFGVVYEDTSIWHNVFQFDKIMLESLANNQLNITGAVTVDVAMGIIHDLFFNPKSIPGAKVNNTKSLTTIALQWLMPAQLMTDIGLGSSPSSYWGELSDIKKFSPTAANLAIERPTDYLSGNAWAQLKKLSVPEFHELFTETDFSGAPHLYFRPIPFGIDNSNYPALSKFVTKYKDVPSIQIAALDLIDATLGEDNHARYNSFLVTLSTGLINVEDNISLLAGSGFPLHIQDSIKRYGFRPMHVTVDSIVKSAERANGTGNPEILKQFNQLMFDYWNLAVFAETGEINLIGQTGVKLGKCMTFDDASPYVYGKRYYIEGYTDTFATDDKGAPSWTQSVMVTHGFFEADLLDQSNIGNRALPFTHQGEFTSAGNARTGDQPK